MIRIELQEPLTIREETGGATSVRPVMGVGATGATGATGAAGIADDASITAIDANPASAHRIQEDARLSATIAAPQSPVAAAAVANTDALNGGTAAGKKVIAGETVAGKLVFEIATQESNGYTTLNLFPSTESSRTKVSLWAKSPDDLDVAEKNPRLLSLEAHSTAEEGVSHFTLYAQMKSGMTTQNGRSTVAGGGPLLDYQGHVFQVATEDQWDNRFELLTFLQAKGLFPDDLWQTSAAVYAGISDVGGYPTVQLSTSDATQLNRLQNRNGVFEIVTASGGSIKLSSAGGTTLTGGQVHIDDSSFGMRVRGVMPAIPASGGNGIWMGRIGTDQSQPAVYLANGTAAQQVGFDNRSGRFRFIVNASVPLALEDAKVGFYGVAPAARPAAYTQTYSTASRTVANPTAAAVVTTAAALASYGFTQAQADALVAAVNALVVDVAGVKQNLNSAIDDDQTLGLKQ